MNRIFVADEMKFIIVRHSEDYRLLSIKFEPWIEHAEIVMDYAREIGTDPRRVAVYGGGMLDIDRKEQKIWVHGSSLRFGQAHGDTVTRLLQEALITEGLENFELKVSMGTEIPRPKYLTDDEM